MSAHMKPSSRLLRTALLTLVLGLIPGPLYEVQRGQIDGKTGLLRLGRASVAAWDSSSCQRPTTRAENS